MNYIIFDLEWNQSPWGKEKENKELPFEIVEIGAVMLNEDRRQIGEFHQYVSPVVYRELHRVTKDIIKLTIQELDKGMKFQEAAEKFFDWCGQKGRYTFCTWGSMDLTELQRNCNYFHVEHDFEKPLIYYDIQKLYSICYDDGKSRVALETAVDELKLKKDVSFHSAFHDALYTAQVFEKLDFNKVSVFTSVDTYRIPRNRKEEYTLDYGTYSKYISRGFRERDDVMKDGNVLSSICNICQKNAKKKIRWFSSNQKMYYCLAVCPQHGYIKGKIKIKKTDDDFYYVTKIIKATDENGAMSIRQRQQQARIKRREKRHREKAANALKS